MNSNNEKHLIAFTNELDRKNLNSKYKLSAGAAKCKLGPGPSNTNWAVDQSQGQGQRPGNTNTLVNEAFTSNPTVSSKQ